MGAQLHLWGDESPDDRLRWSVSRDKRLRNCPRKYYLFHFASRGALQPGATHRARELFILRTLRNRYMWVGEVVHNMIELCLSAWSRHENVSLEDLVERGTRTMRAHYAESLQGMYRERPMRALGLVEHEHRMPITREEWRERRDHMERCLRNFFALELTQTVRALPRWRWLALESSGTFEIDGAMIMVKPDLAWRDEEDRVVMVDWKTGVPHPADEEQQLAVYGLFAQRTWGLRADHMRAVVAYLSTGETREVRVEPRHLEVAEAQISESLVRMRALVEPGERDDLSRFPMRENPDQCALCGFRKVCGR